MLNRILAIMLATMISSSAFGFRTTLADTIDDKARLARETRSKVLKLGVGERARVEVKLRDDSKLKGYISAAAPDSFTLTNPETGASTIVAYSDVAQLKKRGGGLSTMTKVLIGGAVVAGVVIGWQILKPALCDGGAQSRGLC